MEKINEYWVDENNNKWNCLFYTEKNAEEYSKALVNCKDCIDCIDCRYCINCEGCTDCRNCKDCKGCTDCRDCTNCRYCTSNAGCVDCTNCRYCIYCRDCIDCGSCRNCMDCTDCTDCKGCTDCTDCRSFKRNPMRFISGYIGSRKSQTIVYWDCDINLVKCGCFVGDLLKFEKKVKEKHTNNPVYLDEYMRFIDLMWINIENA